LVPDRAAKQKYQNNIQLLPGTPCIPVSGLFCISAALSSARLEKFYSENFHGMEWAWQMEYPGMHLTDADQLGVGSQKMAMV
jgi:heme/copper-type cytochrome/quinol oxidase subunit 2